MDPSEEDKAGRRNNKKDRESVQKVHDLSKGLGAECGPPSRGKGWSEKAVSLDDITNQIRHAWYDAFADRGQPDNEFWVRSIYAKFVIVEDQHKNRLLSYPYQRDDEGAVIFEDPIEVEMEFRPVVGENKVSPHPVITHWTCGISSHTHEDAEAAGACINNTTLNTPQVRGEFVKSVYGNNVLKMVSKTDDALVVANYIALFGGRDLEGIGSDRVNFNGTIGEFFTKNTDFESDYTATGRLLIDWEHGHKPEQDGPGADDVFGYVDWKSAVFDDRGVWVQRVLNRRNEYMKWLEDLLEAGMIGTSTEPISADVVKGVDGEIVTWPLRRDTFTVQPMEPRMMTENHVQLFKTFSKHPAFQSVYDTVFGSAVAQAAAIAEAQIQLVKLGV